MLCVAPDTVRFTVATTPLGIAIEFNPHNTHVEVPEPLLQESDLFEGVLALMLTDEKSTAE